MYNTGETFIIFEEKKGVNDMSKAKSKLSIVIAITALLTIILALVFPSVYLESLNHHSGDTTYIFGFTTTFGGSIVHDVSQLSIHFAFNVGTFLALLFVLISAILILVFDKQISSYVLGAILFITSGVLFLLNERFIVETNGVIQSFSNYLHTGFGTYVSIGLCSLAVIECLIGAYLVKVETSTHHRHR